MCQIRTAAKSSKGGIIFDPNTQDTEKWNTQVAKVIAIGPVAFHTRDKLEPWPEGDWVHPGDFIRVPKYGGDRFEVPIDGSKDNLAMFVIYNDLDLIAKITGDPLEVIAFI